MTAEVQPETSTPERKDAAGLKAARKSPPTRTSDSSGKSWKSLVLIGILIAGLVAVVVFALGSVSTPEPKSRMTHTITRGDLTVSVTEEGTLESSNNMEIKCEVKGGSTILSIVEDGTEVQPGDELFRLDMSELEETISRQEIAYENALADVVQATSNVSVAEISLDEYIDGTFPAMLKRARRDLTIAESNVKAARDVLEHSKRLLRSGYVTNLQYEQDELNVEHSALDQDIMSNAIDVLEKYTRPKAIEELEAALATAKARRASQEETLKLEKSQLERARTALEHCVVLAETHGLVIYPVAQLWKTEPDIEEGARVREQQVLLMIPDLTQMQVEVGIHESKIDKLHAGLPARVRIQGKDYVGELLSVATVTAEAGWWNGNIVEYDTIVKIDESEGLKPGMSAEVEIFLARHEDVLTIPVAAVLEDKNGFSCWVTTDGEPQRRNLKLGDSNDQFTIVQSGLKEGDRVVLNPLAFIDEAQREAMRPVEGQSDGAEAVKKAKEPSKSNSQKKGTE